jgi:lipoyl(octanoyl) transferase
MSALSTHAESLLPAGFMRLGGDATLPAFWLGRVDYSPALELMEQCWRRRAAGQISDVVLYLEHNPVITYGRATPPEQLPPATLNLPRLEVNRGGLATYHGVGQLIGYLIIDLRQRQGGAPDLHAFLRAVEDGIMTFLRTRWRLPTGRVDGKTGVWISDGAGQRKICSMGIAVRRWVTYHGFALNVSVDLEPFAQFVPCGLHGVKMTSVAAEVADETGATPLADLAGVARELHPFLHAALVAHGYCTGEEGSR